MRAQFVFSEVWIGLRRNLTMTIALVVVVAISLSLLGTGLLFVKQVDNTRAYWQSRVQLTVYLCSGGNLGDPQCKAGAVTTAQRQSLEALLDRLPEVAHVTYVSQAQGYQQFRSEFSQMHSFASTVSKSAIPAALQVKLTNAQTGTGAVVQAVAGAPGVDQIGDGAAVLDKFYRLLDGARNAVVVIAVILIIAAILLVANTIRLSAFSRRRETSIMRLVGASNFYVQLPFLVEGMIAGLIGAVVAAVLLVGVKSLWLNGLQHYFTFNVQVSDGDLVQVIALSVIIGVLLCGGTSFLTLRRYLRV